MVKSLLKYFQKHLAKISLFLLSLVPVLWFLQKPGFLIDGVDTNFPLDPIGWFKRRFFIWNAVSNAGSDFSSSSAGLFFHSIQVFFFSITHNLVLTELFSILFWFTVIILGAYFLARIIFPKITTIQLLFVSLYGFNIYLFNTWENIKVSNLSLVASLPWAIGLILLLFEDKLKNSTLVLGSLFIGIILTGSGINPAYFLCFWFILSLFIIAEVISKPNKGYFLKKIALFCAVIIGINVFWIVPTGYFILGSLTASGSIDKLGFVDWLRSLSENTSILNVLRGQGLWDWYAVDEKSGLPLYIPYSLKYFRDPLFILFSFLLPGLASASLLLFKQTKGQFWKIFAILFVLGVFFGAGSHEPTGTIYSYLSKYLPFFSLFRSPWYIFTPMFLVSLAALVCLFFYLLMQKFPNSKKINLVVIFVLVGNLIYSYPLITGRIYRTSSNDSFMVKFPSYISDSSNWLGQNVGNRTIGYPDDEIEQFKWGYKGIESVLNLASDNETIYSPLNSINPATTTLIKELYQAIRKSEASKAAKLAQVLDIGTLFYKKDQQSISPPLPAIYKTSEPKTFGKWSFYKINDDAKKIYISNNIYTDYSKGDPKSISSLEIPSAVGDFKDTIVNNSTLFKESSGAILAASNNQLRNAKDFANKPNYSVNEADFTDLGVASYSLNVPYGGIYKPVLERYKLEDFGIDPTKDLTLKLNNQAVVWQVEKSDDSFIYFKPQKLNMGINNLVFDIKNPSVLPSHLDLSYLNKTGTGDVKVNTDVLGDYVSIYNGEEKDVSLEQFATSFDYNRLYLIQVMYKQIYGNYAQVLVGQQRNGTNYKIQAQSFPLYPDWVIAKFVYTPVQSDSDLRVVLVSPWTKDNLGTKVFYKDVRATKVFDNGLFFISDPKISEANNSQFTFRKISPVEYRGEVKNAPFTHVLTFLESYSPNWSIKLTNSQGKPVNSLVKHFTNNFYANGWIIEGSQDYSFSIYYKPQYYYMVGGIVSGLVIVVSLLYSILRRNK